MRCINILQWQIWHWQQRIHPLADALRVLWKNVTTRRMYITGGLGSQGHAERFTIDYDLPNDTAYTETCAAIGLIMWAQRMLQIETNSSYADVMERAIYNGALSGYHWMEPSIFMLIRLRLSRSSRTSL